MGGHECRGSSRVGVADRKKQITRRNSLKKKKKGHSWKKRKEKKRTKERKKNVYLFEIYKRNLHSLKPSILNETYRIHH